jgi:hypothetical protein
MLDLPLLINMMAISTVTSEVNQEEVRLKPDYRKRNPSLREGKVMIWVNLRIPSSKYSRKKLFILS